MGFLCIVISICPLWFVNSGGRIGSSRSRRGQSHGRHRFCGRAAEPRGWGVHDIYIYLSHDLIDYFNYQLSVELSIYWLIPGAKTRGSSASSGAGEPNQDDESSQSESWASSSFTGSSHPDSRAAPDSARARNGAVQGQVTSSRSSTEGSTRCKPKSLSWL